MEIFCVFFIIGVSGVTSYSISDSHDAMMYLNRFGYINDEDMPADNSDMPMSSMRPMLMEFQKVCNIEQTGELDKRTMDVMNAPRCGNLDMNLTGHHNMFLKELDSGNTVLPERYKRFAITDKNFKWTKRELTYKMGMFSEHMNSRVKKDVALIQIHRAFELWSEVTNLDFIHRPNDKKVDIELSFTTRFHVQDNYPFDGPGKTLAHAFPPGEGVLGDVHFEDEEKWTVNSPTGISVLFVACHEIGHSLGLAHSMVKGAIMQPFYAGYSPKLQLHPDDIEGIQSLYGKRDKRRKDTNTVSAQTTQKPPTISPRTLGPTPTPPNTKQPERNLAPDLCKDPKIDAITSFNDENAFVFKGDYVFQIDGRGKGVLPGWPKRIDSVFKGLEGNLDAAVTRKNGKTYFFKGKYYWRFTGQNMDPGYPKIISVHFRGIPDDIDSASEWLNAIYFTKGSKIWRFDPSTNPFVSDKYPIPLQSWGLDESIKRIDASFKAPNGRIYFFYNQLYWRFDEGKFRVSSDAKTSYPRVSTMWWFGCNKAVPNGLDYRNIRNPKLYLSNYADTDDYENQMFESNFY